MTVSSSYSWGRRANHAIAIEILMEARSQATCNALLDPDVDGNSHWTLKLPLPSVFQTVY